MRDVSIITQYQPLTLNNHIGNGASWGLDGLNSSATILQPYTDSRGSKWFQGTAHAIYQNIDFIDRQDPEYLLILSGDPFYEHALSEIAKRHPGKMSLTLAFDTKLAQRIYAGADSFLMPSAFEPCGLSQLIALHYGTLPVVHQIGGLADTVWVYDKTKNEGTGFGFREFSGYQMVQAIKKMLAAYGEKDIWFKMQRTAMKSDFSWHKSASDYQWMYGELVD